MYVLVINCGSSSLKYQLFDTETQSTLCKGLLERIGQSGEVHHTPNGRATISYEESLPDHRAAVATVCKLLTEGEGQVIDSLDDVGAIGHRVVHGGEDFATPAIINDQVLAAIERNAELAPLHNPPNLAGIRACLEEMPGKPNVAVFDTAFHQTMPREAYLYAIPVHYYEKHGIRRYGFHGTSHYYVAGRAAEMLERIGRDGRKARIVTCHLGNGCSMTAGMALCSVDTTMGMTPLEGCVMGTRSGDVDPAILQHIAQLEDLSLDAVVNLLNKKSGLLGLSQLSNDMRDVLAAAAEGNERAYQAFLVFCYRIRKYIGAYAAVMGGLDAVVFTAGIGEHSPEVRTQVCKGLEFLGIEMNEPANHGKGDRVITTQESRCAVLVIGTNEELVIARETERLCCAR